LRTVLVVIRAQRKQTCHLKSLYLL
jgi:hypothetical protein